MRNPPVPLDLDEVILVEHEGLIVTNKPAGTPTAGDSLEQPGSLQHALISRYRRMVWAVHQLDRDTSGLNLFARRKALVQTWVDHLTAGTKRYLAVCAGRFEGGIVDEPLGVLADGRRGVAADGKEARTEFVVRTLGDEATLLEVILHTGRTHQIRIHAAHAAHPILGDTRYAEGHPRIQRHALHAWRIEAGGLQLEAPLPADFAALLEAVGLGEMR